METLPLYRDWLNLSTHLLWCYDEHPRTSYQDETGYTNNGAWLVRKGWAEVEHDGSTWRAGPGEWLVIKPTHRVQRFAKETKLLSVSFEAVWPDGQPWICEGLSHVLSAEAHPALEQFALPMAGIVAALPQQDWDLRHCPLDSDTYLHLQALFGAWLRQLVQSLGSEGIAPSSHPTMDERVLQALRYIQHLPFGARWDIEDVARQAGLSPVHLNRLFRQLLNKTPKAYYEARRLEYTLRCLKMPALTIKDISLELGFNHLSHFNRWFRRHTGSNPRAYRSQALGDPTRRGRKEEHGAKGVKSQN